MTRLEFVVGPEESGQRLDVIVARTTGLSRSIAAALPVEVDGKKPAKSLRLEEGQRVVVDLPADAPPPAAEHVELSIAYEDAHLLVVDKPSGLVVHPAPGHEQGTLVNALLARAEGPAGGEEFRPGIVHRLDAGTSGLIVVAKTEETFELLGAMMSERQVRRSYVAMVEGLPKSDNATIDAPIGRSQRHRKKMAVVAGGRPSITHFTVTERLGDVSVLDVSLETGRTHQIRVHLAEIGHPVVGDSVYGKSRKIAARLSLTRPFLHACRLAFRHPVTEAEVDIQSPLPADLRDALALARA